MRGVFGLRWLKASQTTAAIAITRIAAIDMPKVVPLYHLFELVGVGVGVGVGTTGARVANTVKCVTVAVSV